MPCVQTDDDGTKSMILSHAHRSDGRCGGIIPRASYSSVFKGRLSCSTPPARVSQVYMPMLDFHELDGLRAAENGVLEACTHLPPVRPLLEIASHRPIF
jgi:hypothetical protein